MHAHLALLFCLLAAPAWALPQCTGARIPSTPASWSQTLTLPRFDPALGTLNGVGLGLDANMTGSASIESLDTAPLQFTTWASVQITLTRPDSSVIHTITASAAFVDNLGAFDGTIDFGGPSGVSHTGITTFVAAFGPFTTPADLALFTGAPGNPGSITLPVVCQDTSATTCTISSFMLQASSNVLVCYDYTTPTVASCFGDGSATACPCGNASAVGAGEGCSSSLGHGARLSASGHASVSGDTLVLTCTGLPAMTNALLFQGTAQQNGGAGIVFGDGLRCVSGSIVRLSSAMASGGVATWPHGGGPDISMAGSVQPNTVFHYQVWYRNAAPFCTTSTFNLSQGLAVLWVL